MHLPAWTQRACNEGAPKTLSVNACRRCQLSRRASLWQNRQALPPPTYEQQTFRPCQNPCTAFQFTYKQRRRAGEAPSARRRWRFRYDGSGHWVPDDGNPKRRHCWRLPCCWKIRSLRRSPPAGTGSGSEQEAKRAYVSSFFPSFQNQRSFMAVCSTPFDFYLLSKWTSIRPFST